MRLRAAVLVAAALAVPAAPSQAAGARLCGAGYAGVVVYDAGGDVATVCVRTSDVVPAVDGVVAPVRDYVAEVRDWAGTLPPRCWSTPDYIVCDGPDRIALPRG